jgi:hypothetical protein
MQTHIPATIALQPHRSHVVKAIFRNLFLQMALRANHRSHCESHLCRGCGPCGGSGRTPRRIRRSRRVVRPKRRFVNPSPVCVRRSLRRAPTRKPSRRWQRVSPCDSPVIGMAAGIAPVSTKVKAQPSRVTQPLAATSAARAAPVALSVARCAGTPGRRAAHQAQLCRPAGPLTDQALQRHIQLPPLEVFEEFGTVRYVGS